MNKYIVWTETQEQTNFALSLLEKFGLNWRSEYKKPNYSYYLYIDSLGIWVWDELKEGETFDALSKGKSERVIRINDIVGLFGPKTLTLKDLNPGQKFSFASEMVWEYLGNWRGEYLVRNKDFTLSYLHPDTEVTLK